MRPIHMLAAAVLALGGLGLAAPAGAAPADRPGLADGAGVVIQVGHRDGGDRGFGRRDGRFEARRHDRDDDRRWRGGDHRGRDDDLRRHGVRSWDDWSRNRHRDRDEWRRHDRGDWRGDRGRHLGWDRGRGHRWHDDDWRKHKHFGKRDFGKKHRHARHHPRHDYWAGRHFRHSRYVVIRDYGDYYLPPPPYGHFYARVDRDVFLVAEGTKRIIDAFVLFDAVGRY